MEDPKGRETEILQRLRTDLPFFGRNVLKIVTKDGGVRPFMFNRAQVYLHQRIEAQRAKTGKVRVIVVKGRQLGSSTYVQGRFYHKTWKSKRALKAFILTHSHDATKNLFGMANRFFEKHEIQFAPPIAETANANELKFADNGCGYAVATAGTRETGRSGTFQLFHGSEVAFWENADNHVAASMNAVGDLAGTEIILESTANGTTNLFYRYAQAALRGDSEFEAVFIPWFWGDDYRRPCPEDWECSDEWYDYYEAHHLDADQLYWAYCKNRDIANSISESSEKPCWKFKQEFPATFDEAFQSSSAGFIPGVHVIKARRPEVQVIGTGPVILGIDPARSGDKVGIIDRCGRRAGQRISMRMDPGGSVTYVAAQIAQIINRIQPDMVNIDVGSNGAGVYDILCDRGYGKILNAVNFGSNPLTKGATGDDIYFNRRAEMYDLMRQWFNDERPVQIPDDDSLQADITAPIWGPGATRYNSNNELILEEKDAIKKRIGASPDLGDALALTFAVPYAASLVASQSAPVQRRGRSRRTGY